jgi:hypothetical protein
MKALVCLALVSLVIAVPVPGLAASEEWPTQ